jgi:hypothetical protein
VTLHGTHARISLFPGTPKLKSRNCPEIVPSGVPGLWELITPDCKVGSWRGLNQTCSPRRDLSNEVSNSQFGGREKLDSRLLVVGSQTASLTPGPSFHHNLGYKCSNDQCMRGHFLYLRFKTFPMTLRTPQCEVFWALLLSSEHSGVSEDSKSPTLEVLGFTPTLGQSGVATLSPTRRKRSMSSLTLRIFPLYNYNCFLLDPWPLCQLCG